MQTYIKPIIPLFFKLSHYLWISNAPGHQSLGRYESLGAIITGVRPAMRYPRDLR